MSTIFIVTLCLVIYFLPTICACSRHHRNTNSITLLNLFLGWTALGWIIAIIWSVSSNIEKKGEVE
jgi:uncharacterized membrane protein YhaH (DUF805 family)